MPSDPLGQLASKLAEKAKQAAGSTQPVWVRLEEFAGIWPALTQSGRSLADKLALLTPLVQRMLQPYPQLAGTILAPVELWQIGVEPESLNVTIAVPDGRAVAVRCGLPARGMRETVIVARRDMPDNGLEVFTRWYADEAGWLDWALTQLGRPPFSELIQEHVGSGG